MSQRNISIFLSGTKASFEFFASCWICILLCVGNPWLIVSLFAESHEGTQPNERMVLIDLPEFDPSRLPAPNAASASAVSPLPMGMKDPQSFHRKLVTVGGVFAITFQDISIPARGWALSVARTYRADNSADTGLGAGWGWSFGVRVQRDQDSGEPQILEADGSLTHYLATQRASLFESRADGKKSALIKRKNGGYDRIFGDGRAEIFNRQGRLIARYDAEGLAQTISYTRGVVASVTDTAGRTLTFESSGRHIARIIDPLSRVTTYSYDGVRLTTVTDGLKRQQHFGYRQHLLTSVKTPDDRALKITYDRNGRASRLEGPGRLKSYFDHFVSTDNDRVAMSVTDGLGNISRTIVTRDSSIRNASKRMYINGENESFTVETAPGSIMYRQNDGSTAHLELDQYGQGVRFTDFEGKTIDREDLTGISETESSLAGIDISYDGYGYPEEVWVEGRRVRQRYDAAGRIVEQTFENGLKDTFEYDDGDRLLRYVNTRGKETRFRYDPGNRLIARTDTRGNEWAYAYNAEGAIARETPPVGDVISYGYDAAGRLIKETVGGESTLFEHDKSDRVVAISNEWGDRRTIQFNTNGHVASITTFRGEKIDVTTDANGLIMNARSSLGPRGSFHYPKGGGLSTVRPDGVKERVDVSNPDRVITTLIYPDGRKVVFESLPDGRPLKIEGPDGVEEEWEYDLHGRPIRYVTLDESFEMTYGENGRLAKIVGNDGIEVDYSYDRFDRLVHVRSTLGNETSYTFDALDQLTSVSNNRSKTEFHYDRYGRIQKRTVDGIEIDYTYAPNGLMVSVSGPGRTSTQYDYDELGRPVRMKDVEGTVSKTWLLGYNHLNEIVEITGPEGVKEKYEYDSRGRLVKQVRGKKHLAWTYDGLGRNTAFESNGVKKTFTYNANGQLSGGANSRFRKIDYSQRGLPVSFTDARGKTWKREYDQANRIKSIHTPSGDKTQFAYNPHGYLVSITDGDSRSLMIERDGLNRIVGYGPKDGPVTRLGYDRYSEIVTIVQPDGDKIEIVPDAIGRTRERRLNGKPIATYRHNRLGAVVSVKDTIGEFRYVYDEGGRLREATNPFGHSIYYDYDKIGRLVGLRSHTGRKLEYRYAEDGQLSELVGCDGQNVRYKRDEHGRVSRINVSKLRVDLEYAKDGKVSALRYYGGDNQVLAERVLVRDSVGNITQLTDRKRQWDFTYDDLNRLSKVVTPDATRVFQYDASGNPTRFAGNDLLFGSAFQLERFAKQEVKHDADGSLRSINKKLELSYDKLGRVVKAQRSGGKVATFRYDYLGRLAEKSIEGKVLRFLYDENRIVGVYDQNGKEQAWLERLPEGPEGVRVHGPEGTGFLMVDHLGTPIGLHESTKTTPLEFSVWGSMKTPHTVLNYVGFTGEPMDTETGLVFMGQRTYLPDVGRFTSMDPAGLTGGNNPYRYADNNPVRYRDATGLAPDEPLISRRKRPKKYRMGGKQYPLQSYDEKFIKSEIRDRIRYEKATYGTTHFGTTMEETYARGFNDAKVNLNLVDRPETGNIRTYGEASPQNGKIARTSSGKWDSGAQKWKIDVNLRDGLGRQPLKEVIATAGHEVVHTGQNPANYPIADEIRPHLTDETIRSGMDRQSGRVGQSRPPSQILRDIETNYAGQGGAQGSIYDSRGLPSEASIKEVRRHQRQARDIREIRRIRRQLKTLRSKAPPKTPVKTSPKTPPKTPIKQPKTPITKQPPKTPIKQPKTPIKQPKTPVKTSPKTPPKTPIKQPKTPITKQPPKTPIKQPKTPIKQPKTPIKTPVKTPPKTPIKQPKTPITKQPPRTPIKQPKTPIKQPKTPIKQPKTPVKTPPKMPIKQPKTPIKQPKTPVKASIKQPKTPKVPKTKIPHGISPGKAGRLGKILGHGFKAIEIAIIGYEIKGHFEDWWADKEGKITLVDVGERSASTVINTFIPIDAYLSGEMSGFEASMLTLGTALMYIPGGQVLGAIILAPIMGKAIGKALAAKAIELMNDPNSVDGKILKKLFQALGWIPNNDPTFVTIPASPLIRMNAPPGSSISPGKKDAYAAIWLSQPTLIEGGVYDREGNIVRDFGRGRVASGQFRLGWNGLDDRSEPVADGIYRMVLRSFGDDGAIVSTEVEVDTRPPEVSFKSAEIKGRQIHAAVEADEEVTLQWFCRQKESDPLRTLGFGSFQSGHQFKVPAYRFGMGGKQTLIAIAEDRAGNRTQAEVTLEIPAVGSDVIVDDVRIERSIDLQPVARGWSSEDKRPAWIAGRLPEKNKSVGEWRWDPKFPDPFGVPAHVNTGKGVDLHYFTLPRAKWFVGPKEHIIQYLWIDPKSKPEQIVMQFYTEGLKADHRVSFGERTLDLGSVK